MTAFRPARRLLAALALPAAAVAPARAQQPARDTIIAAPTLAPRVPLPSEAASAAVTRFSFIAYGDTRGRHDGKELQAEHTLVIESMLGTIARAASTSDPIRFVVQSGDAVYDGQYASQLTVSYIPLINRLTQQGGVPYFLAVGNHDVGSATNVRDPRRLDGLRNYFAANANLIPPEGSPRRLAGYPTFAFGYGNTFFVAFDSAIPDDSTQFDWVRRQLEGLDRRRWVHIAMVFHHPPFSSGPHGGANLEPQAAAIRARWMPLFRKHHVRLLLTGHEHLYEHWVERYVDASGPHRIDEIVSGGGGAPLYSYTGEPWLRDYVKSDSAAKLTPANPSFVMTAPGAGPRHFKFGLDGRHAYAINEMGGTIAAYDYEPATGRLTERQIVPTLPADFKGATTCAEVRLHPSGRFLVGSNRGHD
ncbi:MAG: beta-propeller fold lactonase family protein, partial [Gemmatimonadetes bacterium]|nr:beta-propeller fold lactonase family protein [Gemmatimonadota bacterium]